MAASYLESPGAFRLVAAAAATVGSLALVALGVQIGTNGLGIDGPDRNPASATASPAAAVVDIARPRATPPALDDTLASLVPLGGLAGVDGSGGGPSAGSTGSSLTGAGTGGAAAGGTTGGDASAPPPSDPAPTVPVPVPAPPTTPTVPLPGTPPTIPDPVTILDPLPLVGPIVGGLTGSGTGSTSSGSAAGSAGGVGLLPTLTGLLGL
jgi:hypothetical protein